LAYQVTILAPGQNGMEGLLIGFSGGVCPPGRLGEFLFRGKVRETRFDTAEGIDIGNRSATIGTQSRSPF
jgi:hypothetical protein